MKETTPPNKREYPPVYERIVPISLGILVVIIIGVLIFTIAVALGLLNFA
jgi:hypothetical protein